MLACDAISHSHSPWPSNVVLVWKKERLMYNRLIHYTTKQKILSNFQFGFRKGYSIEMASSVLNDNISKATNNLILRKRLLIIISYSKN